MIYFTSDTHFGHANILKYCNRPFDNVWHMNHQLILNWQLTVSNEDIVYHLGDFSFLPPKQTNEVLECLTGKEIYFVKGNHDKHNLNYINKGLDSVIINPITAHPYKEISLELSHYPELIKGDTKIGLCGHIHTQWRSLEKPDGHVVYNVGVDVWDYKPITINDILDDMKHPYHRVTGEWKDAYHA